MTSVTLERLLVGAREVELRLVGYAAALTAVAAASLAALLSVSEATPAWWVVLGLAAVAAVAERQSVSVTRNIESSVSFLPVVFAAVAFGPLTALIVAALANFFDFRPPYLRWAVYTPIRALTGACAGVAAALALRLGDPAFGVIFIASLAAAVANLVADTFFNALTLVVRRTATAGAYLRTIGPYAALSLPFYVPAVALLAYGYRLYSVWVVAAFLISALALQRLIHLYQEQRDAVRQLGEANERLTRANLSFATALVVTLDARDQYTAGHSAAVAIYARDIARRMGLPPRDEELAHLCGLVHDIGKIGLAPGLLEKRGPLTLEERREMQRHAQIGERILAKVDDYAEIAAVVRHHHERVDGYGYPDGLRGDDIPLLARIVAAADAYDAMTSERPYRAAMPSRVARLRLAQAVETQFDTSVVAAFEAVLASATEEYRLGAHFRFDDEAEDMPQRRLAVAR